MSKAKRDSALYRRGDFRLDWDRRADGSLRSPYLSVFWYDSGRRRIRSASTGTADPESGKRWLDAFYLEQATGHCVCPTCGQPRQAASHLLTSAIAAYQLDHGDKQKSAKAIAARLAHVVDFVADQGGAATTCDQVDEKWIGRFRAWAEQRPIISPNGVQRPRSLSTIEGSVAQLQAAINHAWRRGDTRAAAQFKPVPIRELNRTPQHRAGLDELVAMFRYCVAPTVTKKDVANWGMQRATPFTKTEIVEIRRGGRTALHRFLVASIATLGRPDAVHDISLKADRRQWNSKARILNLNPAGRRQTKKYRASVPIAWQVALHLDGAKPDFFVGPKSVRKAWEAMSAELGLPSKGEAGTKLLRRSMADLLRQRLPAEAWGEIEIFLGHAKFDAVSDLYAPFRPDYLKRALAAIEGIIDEIEQAVPGAFHRTCTGDGATVIPLTVGKNA